MSQGKKLTKRSFSTAERMKCLTFLAECDGNARKASGELAETGFEIDHSVLYRWKSRHAEDYEKIRDDKLRENRSRAAEEYRALSAQKRELSALMVDRLKNEYKDIPVRDLPSAVRNIDTGGGIDTDKSETLTDQASVIIQHRSSEEVIRSLAAQLGEKPKVIEGEAVEIAD